MGKGMAMESGNQKGGDRDEVLGRVLEQALVPVPVPAGFMGSVWRRVRGDAGEAGWREMLAWLFRPGWVAASLVVLLLAGLWHGVRGGQEDRRMAAERRYVMAVEPEASPF
jgi:hypothetical protein